MPSDVINHSWCMVDIETTGTHPEHSAIIQIAAVAFNPYTLTIEHDQMFSRCLMIPPGRYWSDETKRWWMQQKHETLESIFARMEEPGPVVQAFSDWAPANAVFVSKPLSFDAPFISSYFRLFEVHDPFAYWKARDLRSLIQGLTWEQGFDEKAVPFEGPKHDGLFDCLHQIKLLFKAVQQSQRERVA